MLNFDLKPLKLFNLRAQRLEQSKFMDWLRNKHPKNPDMKRIMAGDWLAYEGLTADDLDAFCFNLRLLIQDRDGYSLRCLAEYYKCLPSEAVELSKLVKEERDSLNAFLDEKSLVQLRGHNVTDQNFFEIVLYGGLAHNDEKYFKEFVALVGTGVFSIFSFVTLWNILSRFNSCIQRIASINCEVIMYYEEPDTPNMAGS